MILLLNFLPISPSFAIFSIMGKSQPVISIAKFIITVLDGVLDNSLSTSLFNICGLSKNLSKPTRFSSLVYYFN